MIPPEAEPCGETSMTGQRTTDDGMQAGDVIAEAGAPPTAAAWASAFARGLPYEQFLDRHADAEQRRRWQACHDRVSLTADQRALLAGFVRRMPVLVLAGTWCGDCVNQCPIFDHFARAASAIDLRFLDRDAIPAIAAHLKVCGGQRVPVAAFFSEDFTPIVFYGDRTLSAYRAAAGTQLGVSCPSGVLPPAGDSLAAVSADWLAEFERVQLILRLSGRLRQLHGD
jgi:thiol-disulfide isomerase/thioredoxin